MSAAFLVLEIRSRRDCIECWCIHTLSRRKIYHNLIENRFDVRLTNQKLRAQFICLPRKNEVQIRCIALRTKLCIFTNCVRKTIGWKAKTNWVQLKLNKSQRKNILHLNSTPTNFPTSFRVIEKFANIKFYLFTEQSACAFRARVQWVPNDYSLNSIPIFSSDLWLFNCIIDRAILFDFFFSTLRVSRMENHSS